MYVLRLRTWTRASLSAAFHMIWHRKYSARYYIKFMSQCISSHLLTNFYKRANSTKSYCKIFSSRNLQFSFFLLLFTLMTKNSQAFLFAFFSLLQFLCFLFFIHPCEYHRGIFNQKLYARDKQ